MVRRVRLVAQDTALSRRKHGFNSRTRYQINSPALMGIFYYYSNGVRVFYCSSGSENYWARFDIVGREFSVGTPRTIRMTAESLPRPIGRGSRVVILEQ